MQLFGGSGDNDPFDFEQFYRKYYPMVRSHVLKHSGTEEDARDIFQDLLAILVMESQKSEGISLYKNTKLSTLIFGIVRNLWLQKLTDKYNLAKSANLDDIELSDALAQKEFEQKMTKEKKLLIMERLLKQLCEDCQKILIAFYYKKESFQKIADDMKLTYDYVRLKKYRCMKKLGGLLDNDPDFQNL